MLHKVKDMRKRNAKTTVKHGDGQGNAHTRTPMCAKAGSLLRRVNFWVDFWFWSYLILNLSGCNKVCKTFSLI